MKEIQQEDNKDKKALARKSDMNGSAWSMSSLRTALPYFSTSHSHSHSSQYPNQFSTPTNHFESFDNNCSNCFSAIDQWLEHASNNFCHPSNFGTKHPSGAEEDLRMSAVLNTFRMVDEDEVHNHNITLPSVREESPVFEGHTRLGCIYEGSRYGTNERKILIRRAKVDDELLDEAKRDARRKRKHVQLMQRMKRKEAAINDWQLHQTTKAMDELDKLHNKVERKLLLASARTQKKICQVREKAEKQKMKLRKSTMRTF
ncbi:unnamed protein product [Lupinus luteus]|uniref:Remorin C-terminal domain-containing protein n=1 Tax=Lupinus luteus TaxID=3873 RepID=A0AAV1W9E1_LUPLU